VINTLVTRALKVSDKEHLEKVIEHLSKLFKDNGYDNNQFKNIVVKTKGPRVRRNQEEIVGGGMKISLPYIKGTIDKIAKILRRRNIRVTFSPPNTIRHMVDSTKDPTRPCMYKGVYSIPFSCGKVYISELVDPCR
jgi:hypothetical protein